MHHRRCTTSPQGPVYLAYLIRESLSKLHLGQVRYDASILPSICMIWDAPPGTVNYIFLWSRWSFLTFTRHCYWKSGASQCMIKSTCAWLHDDPWETNDKDKKKHWIEFQSSNIINGTQHRAHLMFSMMLSLYMNDSFYLVKWRVVLGRTLVCRKYHILLVKRGRNTPNTIRRHFMFKLQGQYDGTTSSTIIFFGPSKRCHLENIVYHYFRQLDCWFQGFQVEGQISSNGCFPGSQTFRRPHQSHRILFSTNGILYLHVPNIKQPSVVINTPVPWNLCKIDGWV